VEVTVDKVCYSRPLNISGSSTYIVDVTALKHADDIEKDCFRVWTYNGPHTVYFRTGIDKDGSVKSEKCNRWASGSNVYQLHRLHSVHPSNAKCKRLIALITGIVCYGMILC
jgi:hypothetical protein